MSSKVWKLKKKMKPNHADGNHETARLITPKLEISN